MRKIFMAALILFLTLINVQASAQIDYGTSKIYTREDMNAAIVLIKNQFSQWKGCKLRNIRYAGDGCNSAENIRWLNEIGNTGIVGGDCEKKYVEVMEFLSDFYASKDVKKYGLTFNPDFEYKDWQWWLARTEGGDWELVSWGY